VKCVKFTDREKEPLVMPTIPDHLEVDYLEGQKQLETLTMILAERASQLTQRSNYLRISVIILGALIASREASEKILQRPNWVVGVYAFIGILTAIVGGILATFKLETRAAELKVLAAASLTVTEQLKTKWKRVLCVEDGEEQVGLAIETLESQDKQTSDVLSKAVAHTNVTSKILRERRKSEQALQKPSGLNSTAA
jgi:hypothetical protein